MSEEEKLLKHAQTLPWEDRLLHKNWKIRNDANIELAALCDSITDPKDPRIRDLGLPRKFVMQLWQNALWCSCFDWSSRLWMLMHSCFDDSEESGEASQYMSEPVFSRENYAPSKPKMERHPLVHPSGGVINEARDIITYVSLEQREDPTNGLTPETIIIHSQALLNVKDSNKDERERFVVRRFKFEELRLKQIQDLENDLMKYFKEDLHRRLLSTDFKEQVDGIEMLHKALPSISKEIIEVLDILLKWFVLRFCESNTSCLLKVVKFLQELFDTLRNENYTMNEAEASIFLPCLVEKTGHNNEKLREKLWELMKQIIHSYSAAKTFPYILEGLRSRNNNTRITCTNLVGFLLDNHCSEIKGQLKSLQIIARLTAEQNDELRKSALNCLVIGYKILGDEIWIYIGKLSESEKSLIDETFKFIKFVEDMKVGLKALSNSLDDFITSLDNLIKKVERLNSSLAANVAKARKMLMSDNRTVGQTHWGDSRNNGCCYMYTPISYYNCYYMYTPIYYYTPQNISHINFYPF